MEEILLVSDSTNDQAINPELQRVFASGCARRLRGELSHVPFVSNPTAVADIIQQAANATAQLAATAEP